MYAMLLGPKAMNILTFDSIMCTNLIGATLIAAAEQVEYRHDTRPFLFPPFWTARAALQMQHVSLLAVLSHAHLHVLSDGSLAQASLADSVAVLGLHPIQLLSHGP